MRLSAVEVFAGAYNIGYIKKYDACSLKYILVLTMVFIRDQTL
jgi:hypothetical protein